MSTSYGSYEMDQDPTRSPSKRSKCCKTSDHELETNQDGFDPLFIVSSIDVMATQQADLVRLAQRVEMERLRVTRPGGNRLPRLAAAIVGNESGRASWSRDTTIARGNETHLRDAERFRSLADPNSVNEARHALQTAPGAG